MSTEIQQQNELLQQTKNEAEKLYELLDSRKRENESLAQDVSTISFLQIFNMS